MKYVKIHIGLGYRSTDDFSLPLSFYMEANDEDCPCSNAPIDNMEHSINTFICYRAGMNGITFKCPNCLKIGWKLAFDNVPTDLETELVTKCAAILGSSELI